MRRDDSRDVVNVAVNQTLDRTIITAGTTLLSVLALFLFGGEVLRAFAFTMIVGVITGTYSSVFIAVGDRHVLARRAPARVPAGAPPAAGPLAADGADRRPTARNRARRRRGRRSP